MAHDVFISHSSKDKAIADAVCAELEAAKIRCWIAPRDIRPGQEWPEAIVDAITATRIMVLIFSSNSNTSEDVAKELTLAFNSKVIVIPFKIDNITPKGVMQYYLSNTHWLDAMNPPTTRQIQELVKTVASLIEGTPWESARPDPLEGKEEHPSTPVTHDGFSTVTKPVWFGVGLALLALFLILAPYMLWLFKVDGWDGGWYDPWYINFITFLALTLPLLIPALYCLRRGMTGGHHTDPGEAIPKWWWAVAAVLGLAGGMIAWVKQGKRSRRAALNMLTLGFLLTPLWAIPFFVAQSAPAIPEGSIAIIGSWPTSREANSVYVSGNTVYIANGEDGLVILDVSDGSPTGSGDIPR